MKRIMHVTVCALAAFIMSNVYAAAPGNEKISVMVIPLQAPGISEKESSGATKAFRAVFGADVSFALADSAPFEDDAKNLYAGENNLPDPAIFKKIAEKSGAAKIIAGTLARDDTGSIIKGSLFDAGAGAIEYETSEESPVDSPIEDAARQVAGRMALRLKGALPTLAGLKAGLGDSTENVPLCWQALPEGSMYQVFRAPSESGRFRRIANADASPFDDADAIPGVKYWYRIRGRVSGIFTDLSAPVAGYRKIPRPAGLSLDAEIRERTTTPKGPVSGEEKAKEIRDEGILKRFYIEPMQLNLIMFFAGSYIKSGKIIILRDFDSCSLNEESGEITFESDSSPYVINFKSKRIFRLRKEGGDELFDRLMKNSLFFCAYTGDKEILMEDGTVYMAPGFEAIGLAATYNRNDRNWRQKTIMLNTDNKEYMEQIKKAGSGN